MANELKNHPWEIDTASTTVVLWTRRFKVDHFAWQGYTDQTHVATVLDQNDRPVWQGNGTTDLETIESSTIGWINGLKVSALGSGKLYVFFE